MIMHLEFGAGQDEDPQAEATRTHAVCRLHEPPLQANSSLVAGDIWPCLLI